MKILIILFSLTSILVAHEDPTDVIDTLTHKIEKLEKDDKADPKTLADLYSKRGTEYRAALKSEKAELDFLEAAKLNPQSSDNWLILAKLKSHSKVKFQYAQKAHQTAMNDLQKSSSSYVLAECYYLYKHYDLALKSCEESIRLNPTKNLSPLLFKSHLLYMLGDHQKRILFLTEAQKLNPSIVLRNQYIDAMIDAGKGAAVQATIEKELAESRFKSSWYIRLARIDKKKRKHYVEAAFKEIKNRQNNKVPDLTLFMDLVQAYKLYGYDKRAVNTLRYLESNKLDPWQLAELKVFKE